MGIFEKFLPFSLLWVLFLSSAPDIGDGAGCKTKFRLDGLGEKMFKECLDLQTQGASIAWTLFPHNRTLDIVFSGYMISPSGWVGWGINPEAPNTMVGTRTLIAFRDPSGSPILLPFYLSNAVKTQQTALVSHSIDMHVLRSSVELTSSSTKIFATLKLSSNHSSLNHVWNRGVYVQGYSPTIHGTSLEDLKSTRTVEMLSGAVKAHGDNSISTREKLKITHGILNSVSWGFLLLIGVISARYLRPFQTLDPAWFYIHVFLQLTGYTIGITGWAIGLRLGKLSQGVVHGFHRNLAIAIFTLGSLQIFALLFRPKKTHKLRKYWKSYHHFVGYACIIISVVNVFEGINLLQLPQDSYVKLVYSLAISSLIGVCVVLEVNSWIIFFRIRREEEAAAAATKVGSRAGRLRKY